MRTELPTELLHQRSISQAHLAIAQGIGSGGGIITRASTGLVCDTDNLESLARLGIDKVRALDDERLNSGGEAEAQG
jgi:hypothetical protein